MYVLIEKESNKITVFETKSDLAAKINAHRNTITNRFKDKNNFKLDIGTVYKVDDFIERKRSGNKDSWEDKVAKREGRMKLKRDK